MPDNKNYRNNTEEDIFDKIINNKTFNKYLNSVHIECQAVKTKGIFISAFGEVFPCCTVYQQVCYGSIFGVKDSQELNEYNIYQKYDLSAFNHSIKEIVADGFFENIQDSFSKKSILGGNVNKTIFNNKCQLLTLSKSYRTTIEITDNANKVLEELKLAIAKPVIRHGKNVEFLEYYNNIDYKINKINEWIEKGYKTIAIICKTEKEAKDFCSDFYNNGIIAKYISMNDSQYSGGIFVLTSASAKGLEFDAVIVNNASNNIYLDNSDVDMHLLYVACTRALHEQIILHNGNLAKPFENHTKNKILIRKK